jgi:LytR cell envelope-related transcriptional attenuator
MPDDFAEDVAPRRSAAQVNIVRATVVVVCFLAATIWLLGPASNYTAGAPSSTTPTTHPPPPVVKSQTTVQVANGTTAPNAAKNFSHNLTLAGWNVLTALDTTPAPTTSHQYPVTYVYFHPMQQPAAQLVAAELGVPANHVFLRTRAMLDAVPSAGATDVIVILGTDKAH